MKPFFKTSRFQKRAQPDYRKKNKILEYINKNFIEPANEFLSQSGNF